MHKVICPVCNETREVKAHKSWMVGTEPYVCRCKKHAEGKNKTQAHRDKLSKSMKKLQTEEVRIKKSEYMKSHPEIWQKNIRVKGCTFKHSDETKIKIGQGVHQSKVGGNNES